MSQLKNFYTATELSKLSPEELMEISSFKGGDETFFYRDITSIREEDGEFCIVINGEEIFAKDAELIERIKVGKARYDLLEQSIKKSNEEAEANESFRNEIRSMISTEMENIHSQVQTNRTNFDLGISANEKILNDKLSKMEEMIEKAARSWDNKMDTLNKVDTKKFDAMMTQMETITKAFGELLK